MFELSQIGKKYWILHRLWSRRSIGFPLSCVPREKRVVKVMPRVCQSMRALFFDLCLSLLQLPIVPVIRGVGPNIKYACAFLDEECILCCPLRRVSLLLVKLRVRYM